MMNEQDQLVIKNLLQYLTIFATALGNLFLVKGLISKTLKQIIAESRGFTWAVININSALSSVKSKFDTLFGIIVIAYALIVNIISTFSNPSLEVIIIVSTISFATIAIPLILLRVQKRELIKLIFIYFKKHPKADTSVEYEIRECCKAANFPYNSSLNVQENQDKLLAKIEQRGKISSIIVDNY